MLVTSVAAFEFHGQTIHRPVSSEKKVEPRELCEILCDISEEKPILARHNPWPSRSGPSARMSTAQELDDEWYSFSAWWERTYGYEAHPKKIEAQKQRSALEKYFMQAPSPLELPPGPPASALQHEGVVRLNGVLSTTTAATLRAQILERRAAAYAAIDAGGDWRPLVGDLVLKDGRTRCDLLLPLTDRGVQLALRELLLGIPADGSGSTARGGGGVSSTPLCNLLTSALGDDAVLYELSALISEPGTTRQLVHHDNPQQTNGCLPLLTCFVALQDVDPSMGGTIFLPATHTLATHAEADRDAMLARSPSVEGLLHAGDASLYDSRIFHLGGANDIDGGSTRAIFYLSFINAKAAPSEVVPGSLLPQIESKALTIRQLCDALATLSEDPSAGGGPFCDAHEKAQAVAVHRQQAAQGQSSAQLSLGLSYSTGEGVEQDDAEAVYWFRLAAANGEMLAQTHLGHSYFLGHGVEKDVEEAARWYELAAAQGEAGAQHSLGVCYSLGLGVAPDIERALELQMDAAAQGRFDAKAAYDEILRTQR